MRYTCIYYRDFWGSSLEECVQMKTLVLWTSTTCNFAAGAQTWLYPTCTNHVVLPSPSLQTVESMCLEECQVHEDGTRNQILCLWIESSNRQKCTVILKYLLSLMSGGCLFLCMFCNFMFNFSHPGHQVGPVEYVETLDLWSGRWQQQPDLPERFASTGTAAMVLWRDWRDSPWSSSLVIQNVEKMAPFCQPYMEKMAIEIHRN